MPAPLALETWLRNEFPSPHISIEWLDACYEWITTELNLNPGDNDELKRQIRAQLLQSDLADSAVPNTGFPFLAADAPQTHIPGPVLCQVTALTEIGHSAFSLKNVRQTRIDKADMTGLALAQGDEEAAEDEGPVPKYPRSMLRLHLSDGNISIPAFEYRRIPGLMRQMLVHNALVRGGYVFLEPASVTLLAYGVDELDQNRDVDFLRGLRQRLGHEDDDVLGAPQPPGQLAAAPPPPLRHDSPAAFQPLPPVSAQAHFPVVQQVPKKAPAATNDELEDMFDDDEDDDELIARLEAIEKEAWRKRGEKLTGSPGKQKMKAELPLWLDDPSMDVDDPPPFKQERTELSDSLKSPAAGAQRFSKSLSSSSVLDGVITIDDSDDEKENGLPTLPPARASQSQANRWSPIKKKNNLNDVIEISD
ncbi:hypothetical protein BKA62DRAFT_686550 [Auriculariales sp. MPI-PUGE-AT-0066]|nr:hypothetical protein BKA62DRAFT_686550 [Auriculariales sp. MPI-PUGE-AT-0066]